MSNCMYCGYEDEPGEDHCAHCFSERMDIAATVIFVIVLVVLLAFLVHK